MNDDNGSTLLVSLSAILLITATLLLVKHSKEEPKVVPPIPYTLAASTELINFHGEVDQLMSEHVTWTRSYLKAVLSGAGDEKAAGERLMRNQVDIGMLFARFYGQEIGGKLTALLKEHVNITAEIISNAKTGKNSAHFESINRKWQDNGHQIADFLVAINPIWTQEVMRDMMDRHLSTTAAEILARTQKDWGADVIAYDQTYHHMLMFSNVLVDGIVRQFPNKFK